LKDDNTIRKSMLKLVEWYKNSKTTKIEMIHVLLFNILVAVS